MSSILWCTMFCLGLRWCFWKFYLPTEEHLVKAKFCKAKILSQHQFKASIRICSKKKLLIWQIEGPKNTIAKETLKLAYLYLFCYKNGFRQNLDFNICARKFNISMEFHVAKQCFLHQFLFQSINSGRD